VVWSASAALLSLPFFCVLDSGNRGRRVLVARERCEVKMKDYFYAVFYSDSWILVWLGWRLGYACLSNIYGIKLDQKCLAL
jgi:hypothetical protein